MYFYMILNWIKICINIYNEETCLVHYTSRLYDKLPDSIRISTDTRALQIRHKTHLKKLETEIHEVTLGYITLKLWKRKLFLNTVSPVVHFKSVFSYSSWQFHLWISFCWLEVFPSFQITLWDGFNRKFSQLNLYATSEELKFWNKPISPLKLYFEG